MKRELIIFTDSGDTIIDEATQVFDHRGIVQEAEFIPGAKEVLEALHNQGYTIALVADGEAESFDNVYRKNGMGHCFSTSTISEIVGHQKPHVSMFEDAMTKQSLTEADKKRIVMIGNNLKKDIAGANRFGLISIWINWSPRYMLAPEAPEEVADYVVNTPEELLPLLESINRQLESRCAPH